MSTPGINDYIVDNARSRWEALKLLALGRIRAFAVVESDRIRAMRWEMERRGVAKISEDDHRRAMAEAGPILRSSHLGHFEDQVNKAERLCRELAADHDLSEGSRRADLVGSITQAETQLRRAKEDLEREKNTYLDKEEILNRIKKLSPENVDEWPLLKEIVRLDLL